MCVEGELLADLLVKFGIIIETKAVFRLWVDKGVVHMPKGVDNGEELLGQAGRPACCRPAGIDTTVELRLIVHERSGNFTFQKMVPSNSIL